MFERFKRVEEHFFFSSSFFRERRWTLHRNNRLHEDRAKSRLEVSFIGMRSKKVRYNYPRWILRIIVKAKEFHSLCKIKDASYRYIREYIFEEDVLIITKRKVKR